ncbi:MAG TPA: MerR family transcriptional regulator [Variovorax sp.]|nr:MerR family transcriptional regulator [Variovorax sp.]
METSPSPLLTIAQVARRTGLTAHTLRYYERIGLIAAVPRAAGGQRRYAASDMDWLAFLLRLRTTGMSIQGMQAFARLRSQGDASVGERREMLEAHLAGLRLQMQSLAQSADALTQKIAHYADVERSLSQGPGPEKENHGNHPLPARTRQTEGDRR